MKKMRKIETEHAPKARGPYSQAVIAGSFIFVAGQIPLDPKENKIIDFTIEGQTKQVLANIEAILKAAQLTFADVIRAEIFLKNMDDAPIVNALYEQVFNHPIKPARQMIQAARLPLDSLIEISCVAFIK